MVFDHWRALSAKTDPWDRPRNHAMRQSLQFLQFPRVRSRDTNKIEIWHRRKKAFGLGGRDSRAQTGDPPSSHRTKSPRLRGTEIFDAETGAQYGPFASKRPIPETGHACEMPPFQRNNCNQVCR